jgi:sialate O-acetylesterase
MSLSPKSCFPLPFFPLNTRSRFLLLLFLGILSSNAARADVKMPAIFGDHMVLQRDISVPVWGSADPGETVTVTAGTDKATATAGKDGQWSAKLEKLAASTTPIDVTVAGKNTITFHDILVGDVWVCSGQSNMEFGIKAFMPPDEFAQAGNPQIRLFGVPKWVAPVPEKDIAAAPADAPLLGTWQVCTPDTLTKCGEWSGFSACGFYFGREIQAYTHEPVGLIGSSWGGTRIHSWTSLDTLKALPEKATAAKKAEEFATNYDQIKKTYETVTLPQWNATLAKWTADNKAALDAFADATKQWQDAAKAAAAQKLPAPPRPRAPQQPRPPRDPIHDNQASCALYNGMIAPLIPYAIKGTIWYQGEANSAEPQVYKVELPALVHDWRSHWGQGDFPFLVVQLPNFMPRKPDPSESSWALMREVQAGVLTLPNTGIAVTIDIGDAGVIHPSDKLDVGHRLALAAQHVAYGQPGVYSGPIYKSSTVEGNKIRVVFDNIGSGLTTGIAPEHFYACQKTPLTPPAVAPDMDGFAIAGADQKFVWAKAQIDGNAVVVSADSVPAPVAVRYAWADNPACNLYNKEGLPASPFRTDNFTPAK